MYPLILFGLCIIAPVLPQTQPKNLKMSAIAAVGLPALRAPVRAARRTTASKVRHAPERPPMHNFPVRSDVGGPARCRYRHRPTKRRFQRAQGRIESWSAVERVIRVHSVTLRQHTTVFKPRATRSARYPAHIARRVFSGHRRFGSVRKRGHFDRARSREARGDVKRTRLAVG